MTAIRRVKIEQERKCADLKCKDKIIAAGTECVKVHTKPATYYHTNCNVPKVWYKSRKLKEVSDARSSAASS